MGNEKEIITNFCGVLQDLESLTEQNTQILDVVATQCNIAGDKIVQGIKILRLMAANCNTVTEVVVNVASALKALCS